MALSPCLPPTVQALVPLCLWVWELTFLLLRGALRQAGAEAAMTPGWAVEQRPWRYRPGDAEGRNGGRGSR